MILQAKIEDGVGSARVQDVKEGKSGVFFVGLCSFGVLRVHAKIMKLKRLCCVVCVI